MANEKWFYNLQKKAKEMIKEKYESSGCCNFQDVCKDRVYENWFVRRKNGEGLHIQVIMHKQSGFIQIYESTY